MKTRRNFLKKSAIGVVGTMLLPKITKAKMEKTNKQSEKGFPIVISTWRHGISANEEAMQVLQNDGKAIDAVEAGVRIPEADPEVSSVGLGGWPDRDGHVTLDACIMDETCL